MCANTDTRVTETLTLTGVAQQQVHLVPPATGVDGQLWYTLGMALEIFLEDEWGGDYPYGAIYVESVVRRADGTYRITGRESYVYDDGPVAYVLECDTDGSAFVYYGNGSNA